MLIVRLIAIGALLFSVGCGVNIKTVPITEAGEQKLVNQSLQLTRRDGPVFSASTPSVALGGFNKGADLQDKYRLVDPARQIAATLASDLAAKYDMRFVGRNPVAINSPDKLELAAWPSDAKYMLDIETVDWMYDYLATAWNRFTVQYSVKLRLIDTTQQVLLAEDYCSISTDPSSDAALREYELLLEDAKLLKRRLREVAQHCIEEFRYNSLNIGQQYATEIDPAILASLDDGNPPAPPAAEAATETQSTVQPAGLEQPVTTAAVDSAAVAPTIENLNVSGTYVSEITSNNQDVFKKGFRQLRLRLDEYDAEIRIEPANPQVEISARRNGNKIIFTTTSTPQCGCNHVDGEWTIIGDGRRMEGSWSRAGGVEGAWNLRKIK